MLKILAILMAFSLPLFAKEELPPFLYKVVSIENWNQSQEIGYLLPSKIDQEFFHLATDGQVDGVVQKYWNDVKEFYVLKLETTLLKGKLVLEANPGGTTQYYHLYHGNIPLKAIVQAKLIHKATLH
jgi:uncharacterized protein (DUF952 family)